MYTCVSVYIYIYICVCMCAASSQRGRLLVLKAPYGTRNLSCLPPFSTRPAVSKKACFRNLIPPFIPSYFGREGLPGGHGAVL